MAEAEYRLHTGYNYSRVKLALKSAAHYKAALDFPKPPTAAMLVGSCLDSWLLDGEKCWTVSESGIAHNTPAGKSLEAARNGMIALKPDTDALVLGMAAAAKLHPIARPILQKCDQRKVAAFGEIDAVTCKGQLDALGRDDTGQLVICDLKKVQSAPDFARDAARFNYHVQAGLYAELVRQATGESPAFIWLVIEEQPPHGIMVYSAPAEVLNRGLVRFRIALDRIRRAEAEGRWPGYVEEITELELPKWA